MSRTPDLLRPTPPRGDGINVGQIALNRVRADDEERAAAMKTLREYAEEIPEPGIGALRFEDFPFQEAWYSQEVADAREVVLKKSAQIGASAWALRFSVRRVDQFGDTAIYVFPTREHVTAFGDERLEPAIEESPYLLRRIPRSHVRTKSHKRIGRGFLHLRGSNTRAGAQSVAAQVLVFDEYDLLVPENLVEYERRISGAVQIGKQPRVVRLGYPYHAGAGIDVQHRSSDQRVWHVTCPRCEDEQPIVWEDNFRWTMPGDETVYRPGFDAEELSDPKVLGEVWRCCRSCEHRFEDSSAYARDSPLRRGRWIATNPESKIVGFHAWRGMVPVTDLDSLVVASRATNETARAAFHVLDLGRAYQSGETGLTVEVLAQACGYGLAHPQEGYYGTNPVTMGVDVGDEKGIHLTIDEQLPPEVEGTLNRRRSLWIGTVGSFEEVAEKIERYRVVMVAADYNPERRLVRWLRTAYPGRVVGVEFATSPFSDPLTLRTDPAGVVEKVTVHRTDAFDGMMDAVRSVRWIPLRTPPPMWLEQMQAPRRVFEVDRRGRPLWKYEAHSAFDYAASAVYALVATEMWRIMEATQAQLDAAAGSIVSDEIVGFRRRRLGIDGADHYHAGMGGVV